MTLTITPTIKNNVLLTVNPAGCREAIQQQIEYVKARGPYQGPKKVLVIGASSGYGLASRISLAFGAGAASLGVSYDKGPTTAKKLGTAGWYNIIYFQEAASLTGQRHQTLIGDAFSAEMKQAVIDKIKSDFAGSIDLVVYSLASGKREMEDGTVYRSVIKAIGERVEGSTVDLANDQLIDVTVPAATAEEIVATKLVMGGGDWYDWLVALKDAGVLAPGAKTINYSYLGSPLTYPFYRDGTLGVAKDDLDDKRLLIQDLLESIQGEALVSVSKAIVSKASMVIPFFSVYCTALFDVMDRHDCHETAIMHKDRLFREMVYGQQREVDDQGRLRPDAWELAPSIQTETQQLVHELLTHGLNPDLKGYRLLKGEFLELNGFNSESTVELDLTLADLQQLHP